MLVFVWATDIPETEHGKRILDMHQSLHEIQAAIGWSLLDLLEHDAKN